MGESITLIPGDGIGPEITDAVVRILESAGFKPRWEITLAGDAALQKLGTPLPDDVLDSVSRTRVALKGPLKTPVGGGYKSINVALRQRFVLYANFRPIQSLEGVRTKWNGLDLLVIRENTEGLYSGLEHEVVPGVVESLKIIPRAATERIARFAFEHARKAGRKKITVIHKANILKMSDGLFLSCTREAAKNHADVTYDEVIVDAACMHLVMHPERFDVLVMHPERFDVLVMPNLYGDIVSDLCAGLVGGLGVVGSANLGDNIAMFEAVHGTAPDIAGRNMANPTALLLSALLMLRHIGETSHAEIVHQAMVRVLTERNVRTTDLGGTATTTEYTDAICREMDAIRTV